MSKALNLSLDIPLKFSHSPKELIIPEPIAFISLSSLIAPNSIVYQYNAPIFSIASSDAPKEINPIAYDKSAILLFANYGIWPIISWQISGSGVYSIDSWCLIYYVEKKFLNARALMNYLDVTIPSIGFIKTFVLGCKYC